jgi:hypothetical protein
VNFEKCFSVTLAVLTAVFGLTFCPRGALARASTYVLAVGHNGSPPNGAAQGAGEAPLQYADDDAAAFYDFAREFSRDSTLLTVMDADTQMRHPHEVAEARPPTLAELRAQVQRIRGLLEKDRERGDESVLLFFYSGHGNRPAGGPPALTLLDGPLTHDVLYNEVLSAIPARYIHIFIDACYAEAIVRPRDADATAVDVTETDMAQYTSRATLARFPNVGAMVASSVSSQTHEWDGYRHGVFTHELLSGLRGAADVNLDAKVEYSELYAFLSAANRNVSDPRARLSVVARPPGANARAPIIDLAEFKPRASITDIPAKAGHVHFEDQLGNRLADVRVENGAKLTVMLPASEVVYVRSSLGEAEVTLKPRESIAFEHLALGPPSARARGSLDLAMKRGLFGTGFGPNYYRGFIDQSSDFVAVPFPIETDPLAGASGASSTAPDAAESKPPRGFWPSRALFLGGGVTESVGKGLGVMATMRLGLRPQDPTGFTATLDGAWGQAAFAEWRVLASAGYRIGFRKQRFVGFGALEAGAGIAGQKTTTTAQSNETSSWTGALLFAPGLGASYRVFDHVAVSAEGNLNILGFRQLDDQTVTVSLLPTAYLGVAMDF